MILLESPVFDPITGFGETGVAGTYTLPEDLDGTSKFFGHASFVGCMPDGLVNVSTAVSCFPCLRQSFCGRCNSSDSLLYYCIQ